MIQCDHEMAWDIPRQLAYCMKCAYTWDAVFESPPAAQPHATVACAVACAGDATMLNPDNEPTSEHMQYKDNDQ